MNSRLLLAVVAALLTIVQSKSLQAEAKQWVGTVTMVQGTAILHRGDRELRLVRGAGIQYGDSLHSSSSGALSLVLNDGPAITLADDTSIGIEHQQNGWGVRLINGQARIVHDGQSPMELLTPQSNISVDRAIIHVDKRQNETHLELRSGMATLDRLVDGRPTVTAPNALAISRHSVHAIEGKHWRFEAQNVRLVAAIQTTPKLQPPMRNQLDSKDAPTKNPPGQSAKKPSEQTGKVRSEDPLTEEQKRDDEDELSRIVNNQPAAAPTVRAAADTDAPDDDSIRSTVNTFAGSSSLSLSGFFGFAGTPVAGSANSDANQQTFQGNFNGNPFPGAIHLLTAEQSYDFSSQFQLTATERMDLFNASLDPKYYSIGQGPEPTSQVVTNFFTGTSATPNTIKVPRFDLYVLELDQYNYPDPVRTGTSPLVGIAGLVGATPTSPTVAGATALEDTRSPNQLNSGATFALGEFIVSENAGSIQIGIRRSDQDRLIIKDPGGDDANDVVIPSDDVQFVDAVDPRFLPQSPTVKEPDQSTFAKTGTRFSELGVERRAAFTTLMADQLKDFARRTNQTRFVVDGKIVDISGYRP